MDKPQPIVSAQIIADAIIEGATLVEAGRISLLARQGLDDPGSLTPVQAQHVFAAFLLLFDPLVSLRGETAPPAFYPIARAPTGGLREAGAPGGFS